MIYGYIRVSTDKQTTENQRFEILKFAHEKKLSIGRWIEETVSSTKKLSDRKLGALIERMHEDDILVYRSTVFWTHSATKSCCRSQQTALLMSDLGGRFVSMPSNQPGLIVSTLKLA